MDDKPSDAVIGAVDRLLHDAAGRASRYLAGLDQRPVAPAPAPEAINALAELAGPAPDTGMDSAEVIAVLDRIGGPATMATMATATENY